MSYEDRLLHCPDCDRPFTYSANSQALSDELDQATPVRCSVCWQALDVSRRESGSEYRPNPFSLSPLGAPALISANLN